MKIRNYAHNDCASLTNRESRVTKFSVGDGGGGGADMTSVDWDGENYFAEK